MSLIDVTIKNIIALLKECDDLELLQLIQSLLSSAEG